MNEQATNRATAHVCSALILVAILALIFDRPMDVDGYLWWIVIAGPVGFCLSLWMERKK